MVVRVEIVWHSIRNIQNRVENNLTVSVEVDPVHWWIGLLAQTLVKVDIVLFINIVLVSQPQSLVGVDLLPFVDGFFDFLSLWLLFLLGLLDF